MLLAVGTWLWPAALAAAELQGEGAAELRSWLASSAGVADYAATGPELAGTVTRCLRLLAPPTSDEAVDSALALVTADMDGFAEANPPLAVRELRYLVGRLYLRRLRDYDAAVPPLTVAYEAFAAEELPGGVLHYEVADALAEAHFWGFGMARVLEIASAAHARAIAEGETERQLRFAMWLAKAFAEENARAEAEGYFREAIDLATAIDSRPDRFVAYRTLGAFLQRTHRPTAALPVLDTALALATPDTEEEALTRLWLGITHSGLGNLDAAIPKLTRARDLFEELSDRSNGVHARMELARAYRRRGEPVRAVALVEDAMAATAGWTNDYHRLFRHDELSYAYADAGRYDSAYHHLGAHVALRKSIDSATHDREIRALGIEYAAARDEAILEAQADWLRERRHYRWGLGALGALALGLGGVVVARR